MQTKTVHDGLSIVVLAILHRYKIKCLWPQVEGPVHKGRQPGHFALSSLFKYNLRNKHLFWPFLGEEDQYLQALLYLPFQELQSSVKCEYILFGNVSSVIHFPSFLRLSFFTFCAPHNEACKKVLPWSLGLDSKAIDMVVDWEFLPSYFKNSQCHYLVDETIMTSPFIRGRALIEEICYQKEVLASAK